MSVENPYCVPFRDNETCWLRSSGCSRRYFLCPFQGPFHLSNILSRCESKTFNIKLAPMRFHPPLHVSRLFGRDFHEKCVELSVSCWQDRLPKAATRSLSCSRGTAYLPAKARHRNRSCRESLPTRQVAVMTPLILFPYLLHQETAATVLDGRPYSS